MSIKTDLLSLKEDDIWSIVLFTLYKMGDIPECASLSELIYLMPKESVISLCKYYGGMTITIPTLDELENVLQSLLLYKYVRIDNIEYKKALSMLNVDVHNLHIIQNIYSKLCEVLSEYKFKSRTE